VRWLDKFYNTWVSEGEVGEARAREQGKEVLPCILLPHGMKLPCSDRNNKMNTDVNCYDIGFIHHDIAPLGM
jgi:hypothetical protein